MKSLLVVAHGSRRRQSNDEVVEMVEKLRHRHAQGFAHIGHAFLELAEPSIPAGIDALVARGSSQIVILPYFLSAGTHVANDIPEIVTEKMSQYPKVSIQIAPHIGSSDDMLDLLLRAAS